MARSIAIAFFSLLLFVSCQAVQECNREGEGRGNQGLFAVPTDGSFKLIPDNQDYATVSYRDGLNLGPTGKKNEIVIWKNGVVTIGAETVTHSLDKPPKILNSSESKYVLAPLWLEPGDFSRQHTVHYQTISVHPNTPLPKELLDMKYRVGNFSRVNYGAVLDFTPTWALMVDWNQTFYNLTAVQEKLCNLSRVRNGNPLCYYYDSNLKLNFQLLLATNGLDTIATFGYFCDYNLEFYTDLFNQNNISLLNSVAVGVRLNDTYEQPKCVNNAIDHIYYLLDCKFFIHDCGFNYYYECGPQFIFNLTNAFSIFRKTGSLSEGEDYIPYVLLGKQDDDEMLIYANSTEEGLEEYSITYLPKVLDGASNAISTSGIGIGNTVIRDVYVGTNGIISFEKPFYFYYPQPFPTTYPWTRFTYVAAPFWHDVDIRVAGDVYYKIFKSTNVEHSMLISEISDFVKNKTNTSFEGDMMIVAAWDHVPQYPYTYLLKYANYYSYGFQQAVLNQRNSFEAIIISGGPDTYAIYTYNCKDLQNPGVYAYAVIGYNLYGLQSENNPFSGSFAAQRVACGNFPASNWFNLVYQLNIGEKDVLVAEQKCRRLLLEDREKLPFRDIKSVAEREPPCPCTLWQAFWDRSYVWDNGNPYCFYRAFRTSFEDFGQYCCYNITSNLFGSLEKSGFLISAFARLDRSQYLVLQDKELRDVCCGLAGLCNLFLEQRPPNNCSDYQPPVRAWGNGDPHITTLDGFSYTFNGYGEFTMASLYGFLFQARMAPIPGTMATKYVAFAIGYETGNKVEVDCTNPNPFCTILLNGWDVSLNLTNVNSSLVEKRVGLSTVRLSRESVTTIGILFESEIAMAVVYNGSSGLPSFTLTIPNGTLPLEGGLLGNNDRNASNDLMLKDSTMYPPTATDREINTFGNSWLIRNNDTSLFTYPAGKDSEDYYNAGWVPQFLSDVLDSAEQAVLNACTPAGSSTPLPACVFDATETNDISIGIATADSNSKSELAKKQSNNMPPVLTADKRYVLLNVSDPSPASLSVSVTDEDLNLPIMLTAAQIGATTFTATPGGYYIFTWQLPQLVEGDEASIQPLLFYARDSLDAVGTLPVQVRVCACVNGECSVDEILNQDAAVVVAFCKCYPGWEGRYCAQDVDGCLEYACQEGVECEDVAAPGVGATCGPCPAGFTGDGTSKCVDIDECSRGDDTCSQLCTNTDGSFECSCLPGYQPDPNNSSGCVDVDECTLLTHECDQSCTNNPGSYNCTCRDGFTLGTNFRSCNPNQMCATGHPCSGGARCLVLNGTQTCYCTTGFSLTPSNTCEDVDECATSSVCSHMCINFIGGFACSCRDGYELVNSRNCTDIDECEVSSFRGSSLCSDDQVCFNIEGAYKCICPPGQFMETREKVDGSRFTVCASPVVEEEFESEKVTAVLAGVSRRDLFKGDFLNVFATTVGSSVKKHCATFQCRITAVGRRRRRSTLNFDPATDSVRVVVDVNSVDSGNDGVSVEFYVEVETLSGTKGVVDARDTQAAVVSNSAEFESALGTPISFALTSPPSTSPTSSPIPPSTESPDGEEKGEVGLVAIVAGAAGALVGAVLMALALAIVLFLCVQYNKRRKSSARDKRKLLGEGMPSYNWPGDQTDGAGGNANGRDGNIYVVGSERAWEEGNELKPLTPPPSYGDAAAGGKTMVVNDIAA